MTPLDCPVLLILQACLFLRIAHCLNVNAPRIAFTPLPWYYPLSQIKSSCSANLSVKAVHTHGKNALPLAAWRGIHALSFSIPGLTA